MDKIEITTPERDKALPLVRDAVERQKRLLLQSYARTEERVRHLAGALQVDPQLLLAGQVAHTESADMDLLEMEGELALLRHLREQLDSLEHLQICP